MKIHKHSKFSQLVRINEVMAALQLYFGTDMSDTIIPNNEDEKFCDEMLGKVSRSFAAVIRQLPNRLAMDVLIFYLVLRALDTVEDDMTAFEGRLEEKMRILCNFDKIALADTTWTMTGTATRASDLTAAVLTVWCLCLAFQVSARATRRCFWNSFPE